MDDLEQIKKIEEEMQRLAGDLKSLQQRFFQLQQQLNALQHHKPVEKTALKPTEFNQPAKQTLENFIGLRLINLFGIVVLVIGLSIGVKYVIDRNLISETARIGLAYSAGIFLYILSFRLKKKYAAFSALLFSGAMASLYFTTYGAYVYYALLSSSVAFVVMIALTFFTVYQAIVYDNIQIALLGLVGAYGIPFLISKNADRPELFFLYISVINSAVVYLSIKKQWKLVGKIAQVITWLLFIGWAASRFEAKLQAVGFVFMSFFFLLFLFNILSVKLFNKENLNKDETYLIIFNNLALYIGGLFVFGYSFSKNDLSTITLFFSVLTGVQAYAFYFLWKEETVAKKMLAGLSLILFITFIAFRWSGITVTLLWLLTAVGVFSWGVVRKSPGMRIASILLMALTLFKLVVFDSSTFTPVQKIIAYLVLGVLLLVVSFFYQKFKQQLFHHDEE